MGSGIQQPIILSLWMATRYAWKIRYKLFLNYPKQILATRLNHGSPRLLQCIARCFALASISDVVAQHSIDDALRFSIQLMGSTDAELAKHMVGFVANVQTKHRGAKVFFTQINFLTRFF